MKALSLHQPWAWLVATGQKHYETRSWGTPYRGPLAIHAGKEQEIPRRPGGHRLRPGNHRKADLRGAFAHPKHFGAIIAVVQSGLLGDEVPHGVVRERHF